MLRSFGIKRRCHQFLFFFVFREKKSKTVWQWDAFSTSLEGFSRLWSKRSFSFFQKFQKTFNFTKPTKRLIVRSFKNYFWMKKKNQFLTSYFSKFYFSMYFSEFNYFQMTHSPKHTLTLTHSHTHSHTKMLGHDKCFRVFLLPHSSLAFFLDTFYLKKTFLFLF